MKRLEVQTLRRAGHGLAEVAELTGVSPRSVQRMEHEGRIEDPAGAEKARRARMGRPSLVSAFQEQIQDRLADDPALKTGVILERLRRERGYTGGKSALYALARRLRKNLPSAGIPLCQRSCRQGLGPRGPRQGLAAPLSDRPWPLRWCASSRSRLFRTSHVHLDTGDRSDT